MTILFDARRPVKTSKPFGKGLLRSTPSYAAPYTQADLDWLAQDNARREAEARELDRLVDELHAECEALSRLERGLCC